MKPRFVGLIVVVVVLAGCGGGTATQTPGGELDQKWISDTERNIEGNHHAAHGTVVNGTSIVIAPISGHTHAEGDHHDDEAAHSARGCVLYGLNGTNGAVRWRDRVPPANCTIHSVADPTIADLVGDDRPEALVASTTETVTGYKILSGRTVFSHNLTEFGYTKPVIANFGGTHAMELAVADIAGHVVVVGPNGTERWRRSFEGQVQAQPRRAELDGDNASELVVGLTSGRVVALDSGGRTLWQTRASNKSVLWEAVEQIDDDAASETIVGTFDGEVVLLDDDGTIRWQRSLGSLAAVHAIGDGDSDGISEAYVTNATGTLWRLSTADGETEWRVDLVEEATQTTPPPVLGDLDDDGSQELAVALNTGRVVVVSPSDGTVLASYSRDVPIWTHPTVADLDTDGADELIVTYGDGRVVVLDYRSTN